jgi:hypothetical protein
MRRVILALTAVIVLIFLMQPIAQVTVVEANFYPFCIPTVEFHSPLSAPLTIYVTSNVDIAFDYNVQKNLTQVDSFSYSLDKNANSTLASNKSSYNHYYNRYSVFKTLENLANGNHTLTVYVYFANRTVSSIKDRIFTVDTAYIPPKPIMISPLNQATYNTKQVPLTYTNSRTISGFYSLDTPDDASIWIAFTGNTTLTNLSEGSHKLRLSLITETHMSNKYEYFHQTIYFSIDSNQTVPVLTPAPSLNSNNSVLISDFLSNNLFLIAVLSAFGLILITLMAVFYKRRKKV